MGLFKKKTKKQEKARSDRLGAKTIDIKDAMNYSEFRNRNAQNRRSGGNSAAGSGYSPRQTPQMGGFGSRLSRERDDTAYTGNTGFGFSSMSGSSANRSAKGNGIREPSRGSSQNFRRPQAQTGMEIRDANKAPKRVRRTKTARHNKLSVYIFGFLFGVIGLYIIGYALTSLTRKEVQYDVVNYGTIDTPNTITGVIIRDETVYNTPEAGVVDYAVSDNEKVKKGALVCSIKNAEEVAEMEADLEKIDESIMELQNNRGGLSVYSEDVNIDNSQLRTMIDSGAMKLAKSDISGFYDLLNNIQSKMDERNQLLLSESKGDVAELVNKRKEQQALLDKSILAITAQDGGVVSYYLDGKESTFTLASMQALNKKETKVKTTYKSNFKNTVNANTPIFKIVRSNSWYIAAYIPSEECAQWKADDFKTLYIKNDDGTTTEISTQIQQISGEDNAGEKYIVFRATRSLTDFIARRSVTFETKKGLRGFKIPNSAIVEETLLKIPSGFVTDDDTVLKVSGENTQSVPVSVSSEADGGFVFVPMQLGKLNVGDAIKNPNTGDVFTIAEVQNTKGIYVVNSGIAKFKTINLTGAVSNTTHTVIDDKLNQTIYIYDRILTNTENVHKEENVYE